MQFGSQIYNKVTLIMLFPSWTNNDFASQKCRLFIQIGSKILIACFTLVYDRSYKPVLVPLQNDIHLGKIHLIYILLICINIQQIVQYLRQYEKEANFSSLPKDDMCKIRFSYSVYILNIYPCMESFSEIFWIGKRP